MSLIEWIEDYVPNMLHVITNVLTVQNLASVYIIVTSNYCEIIGSSNNSW